MSAEQQNVGIEVRLAEGAHSGLASIVQQYLEQQLAECAERRRRAARIRGRMALTATDYATTVTVDFRGDDITVSDGQRSPLDASIAGPYLNLVRLLKGQTNPLVEHLHGRLRVRSRLARLLLPLRVHRLMKLSPPGRCGRVRT